MTTLARLAAGLLRTVLRAIAAAGLIAAAVLALAAGAAPSGAAPILGEAVVVAARDGSAETPAPLHEGSGATPFSLSLPEGAACRGDSADGGYRVQSFLVPATVELAGLTFGPFGPQPRRTGPDLRQPLYALDSSAYANEATDLAAEPGGPGVIINIPNVDLQQLTTADVPPGDYRVGIACTKGPAGPDQLDRLWAARLEILAGSAATEPPSWRAPDSAPASPTTATSGGGADASADAEAAGGDGADDPDAVEAGGSAGADPPGSAAGAAEPAGTSPGPGAGAPPTFRYPAGDLIADLSIAGGTGPSIAVWVVAALLAARAAALLARIPTAPGPVPR